jgi:hypothetical protein
MFGKDTTQAAIGRAKKRYDNGKQPFVENALQRTTRKAMSFMLSPIVGGMITGTLLGQGLLHGNSLLVLCGVMLAILMVVGLNAAYRFKVYPLDARLAKAVDSLAMLEQKSVNQVIVDMAQRGILV